MRSRPHEHDLAAFAAAVLDLVDQQEIAADVAFAGAGPFALEGVIEPLGTERSVVGDEEEHRFLEAVEVVAAGARKAFPILSKAFRIIGGAREGRALTCRGALQGRRSVARR